MALIFEVTKQIGQSVEQVKAKFADGKDALEFMNAKVAWDHRTKVRSIYRFYRMGEMEKEVDAALHESIDNHEHEGAPAGNSGQRSGMTPLANAPRPPGTPPRGLGDMDE